MGQAAVDLPDPTSGSDAAPMASADDLLAQLAGDEIDRLLSESDTDSPSGDSPDPAQGDPDNDFTDDSVDVADVGAQINTLLDAVNSAASPDPASESTDEQAAEFDRALARHAEALMEADTAASEEDAGAVDSIASSPATLASVGTPAPAVSEEELETSLQERDALAIHDRDDAHASGVNPLADIPARPLPIYLRPLEWLNWPMTILPDSSRELLGKIAIITLFNAVAVLAYVLLFRK